ncbi:nucleotide sugar dehydrogenase [Paenibacillus selenitireducens]|uniref:UDP-glucose 6-dehydrogenase n=1 Tax=Paenibacillus selenitireducens TaxID=1324314 RepID=A0A1T2XCR7_9BACL|nr:UDP-glucose/GDP-mannose dehydrogenase family protein [Paenibacillus selenitireducens]OPA77403.1 nucleotide sugar dehydrogenase [Paenibacillus selenitireducens]
MNILVVGVGYVGTTTALLFAELGWKVTGFDTDIHKIQALKEGNLPFFEPGLDTLLDKHVQLGNLSFTTDSAQAIRGHHVIFICVGTPSQADGSTNLTYVQKVAEMIGDDMESYKLIVMKSTVPIGTHKKVCQWITDAQQVHLPFDVVSNPEFLREGSAVHDCFHPDRIVIGSDSETAAQQVSMLYKSIASPLVMTNPTTAEMIKYASNAFLATKISYMNELARLCDQVDVSISTVAQGMGLDPRIGRSFLRAGIGYGGSCFPKDVLSLLHTAQDYGIDLNLIRSVVEVNNTQCQYFIKRIRSKLGILRGKRIAILGLSFKPGTDDMREAPALAIIKELLGCGSFLKVHDPVAKLPDGLKTHAIKQYDTIEETLLSVHAVILCTEWSDYVKGDWKAWSHLLKLPYLFDGRNVLDRSQLESWGLNYTGIGNG